MDLSKILSISGKSGLYEAITQTKSGLIVQALDTGKKMPVFSSDRSSSLEDISLFTSGEDVPLKKVLLSIFDKEEGKPCQVNKSDESALKAYFGEILPDYDRDRVYLSDMKKVVTWYNILLDKNLISKEEEVSKDEGKAKAMPEHESKPKTQENKPKTQENKPKTTVAKQTTRASAKSRSTRSK